MVNPSSGTRRRRNSPDDSPLGPETWRGGVPATLLRTGKHDKGEGPTTIHGKRTRRRVAPATLLRTRTNDEERPQWPSSETRQELDTREQQPEWLSLGQNTWRKMFPVTLLRGDVAPAFPLWNRQNYADGLTWKWMQDNPSDVAWHDVDDVWFAFLETLT